MGWNWTPRALALGCVLTICTGSLGCDVRDRLGLPDLPDATVDSGNGGDGGDGGHVRDGATTDAASDSATVDASADPLLMAPEPAEAGNLELDEPLAEVVHLSDLVLGLHASEGVSLLDLSDPTEPSVLARLTTTGKPVAVALDPARRIVFVVTISGDLRAYRVFDPSAPVQLAQVTLTEPQASGDTIQGMARVGDRLFLLGSARLIPIDVLHGASDSVGFVAQSAVQTGASPQRLAAGGGVLHVALAGGTVQVFDPDLSLIDEADLGGDITGWVVRGRRLFVALAGIGLRVLDLRTAGTVTTLFESRAFDDAVGLRRFGNLVLVALSRGRLIALDLSMLEAPRAIVAREGSLPAWIAPAGGNLLLGNGTSLSIFGVPPFVSATVPGLSRGSFPRYGRIPIQLSKAVDPSTVSVDSVLLRCDGETVSGRVVVSLDHRKITFMPQATLPAGVTCELSLDGVRDALGLNLSAAATLLSFTTTSSDPEPVVNAASSYPHTADGAFTDWDEGDSDGFEYFDVTAARGMYSHFYADYDGTRLWLLNDWFYNGDDIDPDCYNQFGVWTGGGSQRWDIRAYGDQRIEVRLNGSLLDQDDERVIGGYGHGASPNVAEPHTLYEIAIATEPGTWGVQLHDPGPTFGCEQLETDPVSYAGSSDASESSVDPTVAPSVPAAPALGQSVEGDNPTLSWSTTDEEGNWTTFLVEISSGSELSAVFYRRVVYGRTLALPSGVLHPGSTYSWRVTAFNLAGTTTSDTGSFTVPAAATVDAPTLSEVSPAAISATGDMASLTLTGTGFVEGARVLWDGEQLSTTFVSQTELTAVVPGSLTEAAGTFPVSVRNDPSDADTESDSLDVTVTDLTTLVDLSPAQAVADTATSIAATLTNGPADVYNLVLTPTGGGSETVVFCDWTETDRCDATVNLPEGTYDAAIRVGDGPEAYDTNALSEALSVVGDGGGEPGSCGMPVCTSTGADTCECSASGYTLSCDAFQCECTNFAGQIVDDGSSSGVCGSQTDMENGFASICNSCVNPPAPSCVSDASYLAPSGSGTCADPYVVDLSLEAVGDSFFFEVPGTFANDETDGSIAAGGTCVAGSGRDIVVMVQFPQATMVGMVTAEGSGVDPIVVATPDNGCGAPIEQCSDETGSDACESASLVSPGTTARVWLVSEAAASGQPITISFSTI